MGNKNYQFGCLLLETPIKNWFEVFDMLDLSDVYKTDLEGFGLEYQPHTTIQYGFDANTNVGKIKQIIHSLPFVIELKLTKISVFERDDFDVLIFTVESDMLVRLNKLFAKYFNCKKIHKEYNPHITITYLKKGTGKKYVKNLKTPITIQSKNFIYSHPSSEKEKISIETNNIIYENKDKKVKTIEQELFEYIDGMPESDNILPIMKGASTVKVKKDAILGGGKIYSQGNINAFKIKKKK